jgi:hypothetical protein
MLKLKNAPDINGLRIQKVRPIRCEANPTLRWLSWCEVVTAINVAKKADGLKRIVGNLPSSIL